MENFSILFLIAIIATFASVDATIPNYIKTCKRHDPKLSKCIENSILGLKEKLVEGIPELGVPKLDPLYLSELTLNLGTGVTAECKNLQLTGAKAFEIHDLVADLNADTFTFDISFPEISARGDYEIDATVSSLRLKGKGPITLTAKSVSGRGKLHGKKESRSGKTLYWYPAMDLKLQVKDYDVKLENLSEGDPTIGEVTNKVLNTEKTSVLSTILPGIEKAVIERILSAANNISKHLTWEEMFPAS